MTDHTALRTRIMDLDVDMEKEKKTLAEHKGNRDALMEMLENGTPRKEVEDHIVNKDLVIHQTAERLKALKKAHKEAVTQLADETAAEDPGPNRRLDVQMLEGYTDAKSPRGKPWHLVPDGTTMALCHTLIAASWTQETPATQAREDRCGNCAKQLAKERGEA